MNRSFEHCGCEQLFRLIDSRNRKSKTLHHFYCNDVAAMMMAWSLVYWVCPEADVHAYAMMPSPIEWSSYCMKKCLRMNYEVLPTYQLNRNTSRLIGMTAATCSIRVFPSAPIINGFESGSLIQTHRSGQTFAPFLFCFRFSIYHSFECTVKYLPSMLIFVQWPCLSKHEFPSSPE